MFYAHLVIIFVPLNISQDCRPLPLDEGNVEFVQSYIGNYTKTWRNLREAYFQNLTSGVLMKKTNGDKMLSNKKSLYLHQNYAFLQFLYFPIYIHRHIFNHASHKLEYVNINCSTPLVYPYLHYQQLFNFITLGENLNVWLLL